MPPDVPKRLRTAVIATLLALPAQAQESGDLTDRLGQLFNDLMAEVDPWMAGLLDKLGDLTGWHTPEVLPNGDILIRRRRAEDQPSESDSGSETDKPFEL